ncbi:transposase [Aeoliella mucimassa]|uniref:Transposase IS200 like protein n=1 Tax=Aeoliella mucimassa TaxID=2527972 RepID=A0A518ASL7_9BACT|nr:transposase [Aeoliella mucimassa]QDU57718.1 hypothetical protein Pan181_39400 [Aeoliella mucimassa]
MNERGDRMTKFQWQLGFAAFTVSVSQREVVSHYIRSQQEHHRRRSFQEEFMELLKRHEIDYDPRYVFEQEHVG